MSGINFLVVLLKHLLYLLPFVEIDGVIADSDQAIILDQVLNGVASRMAILYLLCGGNVNHGDD